MSTKSPCWNPPKKPAPVRKVPKEEWPKILEKLEKDLITKEKRIVS